jgi:hypothetical protein
MAWALEQTVSADSGFGTTASFNFTSVAVGDLLVVALIRPSSPTVTVSDDDSNTWTRRIEVGPTLDDDRDLEVWSAIATATGTVAVSVVLSSSGALACIGRRFSGISGFDVSAGQAVQSYLDTHSSGESPTIDQQSASLAIGAFATGLSSPSTAATSGYGNLTTRDIGSFNHVAMSTKDVASATETATFTTGENFLTGAVAVLIFKETVSAVTIAVGTAREVNRAPAATVVIPVTIATTEAREVDRGVAATVLAPQTVAVTEAREVNRAVGVTVATEEAIVTTAAREVNRAVAAVVVNPQTLVTVEAREVDRAPAATFVSAVSIATVEAREVDRAPAAAVLLPQVVVVGVAREVNRAIAIRPFGGPEVAPTLNVVLADRPRLEFVARA